MPTARIESILTELREKQQIPDLRGVRVFVTGATARDDERFRQIRQFWFAYFQQAGAQLREHDYGSKLIRLSRE